MVRQRLRFWCYGNTTAVIHEESAQQKTGDLADENNGEDVIAHELFHHWFGGFGNRKKVG